ncbi:AraC family transcriptional regulator [Rhodococcus fascians]|nr:AraC family transcriptional regulator [Rhodococcus fascians]MBY4239286.1 AraC family transcriptional regulator [Rhodococcus fascians]MBY4253522.1 AraC family transcriptional regulator [Rhodococcus fascians]MBY4270642.1 AraC family transcriptional regulator [Rhodococcus fascians]
MRGADPWKSPDPLGEALHFLRMTGSFYVRSEMSGSWGLALPAMDDAVWFHTVVDGSCVLSVPGESTRELVPGDFALVPHGRGHVLAADIESVGDATSVYEVPHDYVSDRYAVIAQRDTSGPDTVLVCGAVRMDHPAAQQLLRLLPALIVIDADSERRRTRMQTVLAMVADEARSLEPGGEAVITRLSDVLVIQALRSWIADTPSAQSGWLGALQDERIRGALVRIHRNPDERWTVAALASSAHMSRSSFSARFTALVGDSVMSYLATWRMQVAYDTLRSEDVVLAELARRSGYSSEAAFGKAFKRAMGVSPGSVRRRRDVALVPVQSSR